MLSSGSEISRYASVISACWTTCAYLDNRVAKAYHELRMHRAQQGGSEATQLLPESRVTGAAFLVIKGLQIRCAETCLLEQPNVLSSSASVHAPANVVECCCQGWQLNTHHM